MRVAASLLEPKKGSADEPKQRGFLHFLNRDSKATDRLEGVADSLGYQERLQ